VSRFKFELPAIKGTELWPKQIQAPANVRIGFEFPARFASASKSYLENLAQRLMDQRAGTISHYIQAQRRNYHLGVTEVAATHREIDGLFMAYNNIQGVHETVDLKFTVSEEQLQQLEKKSEFQNKLHEHNVDTLMCVVFHSGNQISYTPMSSLGRTGGVAQNRKLKQSRWGGEIIKACQMRLNKYFSIIQSGLADLTRGTVSRGDKFAITTSLLADEVTVSSDVRTEYPIMSGKEYTAYASNATVVFSKIGAIKAAVFLPDSSELPQYGASRAFFIAENGDRYSAFAAFSGGSIEVDINFDLTGGGAGVGEENNPYSIRPAATDFRSWRWYKNGERVSDDYYYKLNLWETGDPEAGPTGLVSYVSGVEAVQTNYPAITLEASGGITPVDKISPITFNYQFTGSIASETHALLSAFTWTVLNEKYANYTFGPISGDYASKLTGPPLGGNTTMVIEPNYQTYVSYIAFPYPRNSTRLWMMYKKIPYIRDPELWSVNQQVWYIKDEPPTGDLYTPYGVISGKTWKVDESAGAFSGWLQISNGKHMIQAFMYAGERYMYLNNNRVSSVLGVSLDAIQAVLFDIPLKKLNEFK